jgi:Membrane bound beta barrel domain (DUF5777)
MKRITMAAAAALLMMQAAAQDEMDSLLNAGNSGPKTEFVNNAFKSSRVIMGHSMEMLGAGVLDFRILHRFGNVKNGISDMFGLDQATMRMGFDYGITKNLTIGVGRSTRNKEFDAFAKYRIKQQSRGEKEFPVGRKISEGFTLQLSPTFVHRNLVELATDENDMIALGIGSRIKLTRSMAFIVDAFPIISGARSGYNQMPLSVGVDIETGGHVFQLHFSNATAMNEKAFIAETTQKWGKGEFQFGFNLSRVFTIKKNKAASW